MASGNYRVSKVHRGRIIIPVLVNKISAAIDANSLKSKATIFYFLNYGFILLTAFVLYDYLQLLGFNVNQSFIGVVLFLTSRVTVYTTAFPLVDSLYYLAIISILVFLIRGRYVYFLILFPISILAKETIIPFLFLPFLDKSSHNAKNVLLLICSLLLSFLVFYFIRSSVFSDYDQVILYTVIIEHLRLLKLQIFKFFTLRGLNDVIHPFLLLLVLVPFGLKKYKKQTSVKIPVYVWITPAIAFAFIFISGCMGRMLFASFPAFIPIILLALSSLESIKIKS